jgi:hypothetical protein
MPLLYAYMTTETTNVFSAQFSLILCGMRALKRSVSSKYNAADKRKTFPETRKDAPMHPPYKEVKFVTTSLRLRSLITFCQQK